MYNLPSYSDPDPDDSVTMRVTLGPATTFVTYSSGVLTFTPGDSDTGDYEI